MASYRKRVRYTLELHFSGEEERDAFSKRLMSAVRQLLSPTGAARVDNTALMSALFDAVEKTSASSPTASAESSLSSSCSSFQRNSGE